MTAKIKPDWAGEDLLSRFVNLLIQISPIYRLMKQQARQVIIKTAERSGIPWRKSYEALATAGIQAKLSAIANPNLTDPTAYPAYYTVPFHAYDEGNLCWEAAFEAEPATYAMALRVWKNEPLTWQAAHDRLRSSFHQVLTQYGSATTVRDILDIGCSVGISTLSLHHYYQSRQPEPVHTTGLDLSPYMLAVAQYRDVNQEITWRHGIAEDSQLPSASFDLITLQFVIHELPRTATQAIFREALRLLRPGGCLAIVDNNPKSTVIQNLPPVLFTLMKSTEPWSDDYYTFDVEAALSAVGFEPAVTVASDPRHRAIVARKSSP